MRFYAACLASYNSGVLHGRWIDASPDVEEMQSEVDAMLRESRFTSVLVSCPDCERDAKDCPTCDGYGVVPSAEEYAIHDVDGIPSFFGSGSDLEGIADFAALVEECAELVNAGIAEELALALVDNEGSVEYARERLENFQGLYDTFWDYAYEQADVMLGGYSVSENNPLRRYFDYEAWARDLSMETTAIDVGGRVAVFLY